jgi:hypothetical protein
MITVGVIAGLILVPIAVAVMVWVFQPAATLSAQIGQQAGQPGAVVTASGAGFPAEKEVYVGLVASDASPTTGTSFVTAVSDKSGKFSVTFTYPAESKWTTLHDVKVYAGTPEGDKVATARLSLDGIAWLFATAAAASTLAPSPTPTFVTLVSPTPVLPATATATASKTPSPTALPVPVIVLKPASGKVGTAVIVTGRGWPPNATLSMGLLGSSARAFWDVGTATTDAAGNISTGFVFPSNWVGSNVATLQVRSPDGTRQALAVFQVTGQATPTVPTPIIITGWLGQYYSNMSLSGDPALTRNDADITFDWSDSSPAPGVIPNERFSVRWTRSLNFPAGDYRFWADVDDGVRLWLDNNLIIDEWHPATGTRYSGDVSQLGAGLHDLKVEYFQDTGPARAHIWWQPIQPATPTPTMTPTPTRTSTPTATATFTATPVVTSTNTSP